MAGKKLLRASAFALKWKEEQTCFVYTQLPSKRRRFYWTKLPLDGSRNYINNQSSVWCREEATQCPFHSQKRWPPSSVLQHLSLRCCAPPAKFSQPKPDSANPNPFSYRWKPKHGLHSHSLNTRGTQNWSRPNLCATPLVGNPPPLSNRRMTTHRDWFRLCSGLLRESTFCGFSFFLMLLCVIELKFLYGLVLHSSD